MQVLQAIVAQLVHHDVLDLSDLAGLELEAQPDLDRFTLLLQHPDEADLLRGRIRYVDLEGPGHFGGRLPQPRANRQRREVLDELGRRSDRNLARIVRHQRDEIRIHQLAQAGIVTLGAGRAGLPAQAGERHERQQARHNSLSHDDLSARWRPRAARGRHQAVRS